MLSEYRSGGIRAVLCRCPTVLVKDKFYHVRCQRLDEAFLSAYSYSHTQLAVFIHLLIDFGEEHLQGEVVITTKDELLGYVFEFIYRFLHEYYLYSKFSLIYDIVVDSLTY